MSEELEQTIMQIIVYGGQARSLAMSSIQKSRENQFSAAEQMIAEAATAMKNAAQFHTKLLAYFAQNPEQSINLFVIHSEDHLNAAGLAVDFAKEFKLLHEDKQALQSAVDTLQLQLVKE